jgi:hypothetical protein
MEVSVTWRKAEQRIGRAEGRSVAVWGRAGRPTAQGTGGTAATCFEWRVTVTRAAGRGTAIWRGAGRGAPGMRRWSAAGSRHHGMHREGDSAGREA